MNCSEEKDEELCVDPVDEKNVGHGHDGSEPGSWSGVNVSVHEGGVKIDVDPLKCASRERWNGGDRAV